jgi:addiction module RelB/DinJ family antitoxin
MDDVLREKTDLSLSELGLNFSSAVNIFARQIVRSHGIPFPLTLAEPQTANRQEAVSKLFSIADANPAEMPRDYKFNRDACYDE